MNTAKDLYAAAREWHEKNEARPISETVRILDGAKATAHEVANEAFDALRKVRQLRDERIISAQDVAEARNRIVAVRSVIYGLTAELEQALASLDHPEILEAE